MKFLVIGDSCTDEFVYGRCDRLSPEEPVPIFQPNISIKNGGMAKNVANNVIALKVSCDVMCNENKMVKTRYVDGITNHMLLRVETPSEPTKKFNINNIKYKEYDAILISLDGRDGESFLNSQNIEDVCARHNNVFVDSKSQIKCPLPNNLRFLKINDRELEMNEYLKQRLNSLHANNTKEKVIVTHGKEGCVYNGRKYLSPAPKETRDLSGAGDTFLAALAVSYVRNNNIDEAIVFANECASIVVSKRGVSTI